MVRFATYDGKAVPHTSKYCKWCEAAEKRGQPRPKADPTPYISLKDLREKLIIQRGGISNKLTLEHRERIRQTNIRKKLGIT